jgi:hypothetical protein
MAEGECVNRSITTGLFDSCRCWPRFRVLELNDSRQCGACETTPYEVYLSSNCGLWTIAQAQGTLPYLHCDAADDLDLYCTGPRILLVVRQIRVHAGNAGLCVEFLRILLRYTYVLFTFSSEGLGARIECASQTSACASATKAYAGPRAEAACASGSAISCSPRNASARQRVRLPFSSLRLMYSSAVTRKRPRFTACCSRRAIVSVSCAPAAAARVRRAVMRLLFAQR